MWPITPVEIGGMSTKNPFIWILQRAEDSFCRNSDKVISLLSHSDSYLVKHGMAQEKFVHIPNGIVEEEWDESEWMPLSDSEQEQLDVIKKQHKKVICFFGSHTVSYALEYIVDAVKEFDSAEVGLLLVGNGSYKEELIKRADKTCNIHFMDSIPKRSIPDLLRQVDIIYIGALDNQMFRFGICMNKLYDAMMAGKPILYAVNAPNNYIEDFKCGISVKTQDKEALVDGIRKFITMSQGMLDEMGNNGRNAVKNHFTIRILAKRFEEEFWQR